MRQLILMRHAKAETASGHGDHTRPLSSRGRAEGAEAGRRLAALATPGLALVSDSLRTRQTFEVAAPAFVPALPHRETRDLYAVPAAAILAAIRATPDNVTGLLVIGHNPGIGDLARALAGPGDDPERQRLAQGFPTACFAVLDFDVDAWSEVAAPARLAFLLAADERSGA